MENQIVIFKDGALELDVKITPELDTVWLTQAQMVELFNKNISTISRHINNIFNESEVERKSNLRFMQIANSDKPVAFYSLDVIISVGYRVKSKRGIAFRKWASGVLKQYLLAGYAVNEKRMAAMNKVIQIQSGIIAGAVGINAEEFRNTPELCNYWMTMITNASCNRKGLPVLISFNIENAWT